MSKQLSFAGQSIQLPDLTMPPVDRHIVNRTASLSKAEANRTAVLASIDEAVAAWQDAAKQTLVQALQIVLNEKTSAFYWCVSSPDELEADVHQLVKMAMRRQRR